MHMLTPATYPTGEARIEALLRTLVAGLNSENEKLTNEWMFSSCYNFSGVYTPELKRLSLSQRHDGRVERSGLLARSQLNGWEGVLHHTAQWHVSGTTWCSAW